MLSFDKAFCSVDGTRMLIGAEKQILSEKALFSFDAVFPDFFFSYPGHFFLFT